MGTERAGHRRWNSTSNGERYGSVQARQAVGRGGLRGYFGCRFAGVLGILRGGGYGSNLGRIVLETAGTVDWIQR